MGGVIDRIRISNIPLWIAIRLFNLRTEPIQSRIHYREPRTCLRDIILMITPIFLSIRYRVLLRIRYFLTIWIRILMIRFLMAIARRIILRQIRFVFSRRSRILPPIRFFSPMASAVIYTIWITVYQDQASIVLNPRQWILARWRCCIFLSYLPIYFWFPVIVRFTSIPMISPSPIIWICIPVACSIVRPIFA